MINPFSGINTYVSPSQYYDFNKNEWTEKGYNDYIQAVIRQEGQQAALAAVGKWAYKEPGVTPGQPFFGKKAQVFPMQPSKTPAPQQIDPRLNPYQARVRTGPRGPSFTSPWIGGM